MAALDYDLSGCLTYNDIGITADDVADVLAVIEGQNDGAPWIWVIRLNDGRFAAIDGWCDYTGWDCQSGAEVRWGATADDAVTAWADEWHDWVRNDLLIQVRSGRTATWRERTDAMLGVESHFEKPS